MQLIQQTLQFLMLHVIWKCQGLTSTSLPSPDETQYQESLTIQRESLLEKLVEFAVGTQCNTVDGVKRTVGLVHCSTVRTDCSHRPSKFFLISTFFLHLVKNSLLKALRHLWPLLL